MTIYIAVLIAFVVGCIVGASLERRAQVKAFDEWHGRYGYLGNKDK